MKRFTEDGYSMEITRDGSVVVVKLGLKAETEAEIYLRQLHQHLREGSINISAKFDPEQ